MDVNAGNDDRRSDAQAREPLAEQPGTSAQERAALQRAAEHIGPDVLVALGGGAARGVSHIGVLRVLEEAGFRIRGVAGTSIGSILGAAYCAGQLDAGEEFLRSLGKWGTLRLFDPVFPRSGVLGGRRLVARCEELIGDLDVGELEVPFVAVATDMRTGREVRLTRGRLAEAIRASSGIPGFFVPQPESLVDEDRAREADEHWLVDGFVASPVPVGAARALGDWPIIAVDVNVPFPVGVVGPRAAPDAQPSRFRRCWEAVTGILRSGPSRERRPSLVTTVASSSVLMQHNLARAQYLDVPPALVLEPNMTGVRMFDFHLGDELIREGARSTRAALTALGSELPNSRA